MNLNIEEQVKYALKKNNKFQLSLLNSVINDPVKIFILMHDAMFNEVIAYQKMYRYIVDVFEEIDYENYKNNIKKRLLDIPVTTGNMTKMLIKKYNIIGADISEISLDITEKKISEIDSKGEFKKVKLDITKGIPLDDESIDRIVSLNLLYAIENPEFVIKEFYRVIKKGGYIVLTNLNQNALLQKEEFLLKIKERYSEEEYKNIEFWKDSNDLINLTSKVYYENYFDKEKLAKIFENNGFFVKKIIEVFLGNAYLVVAKKIIVI